MTKNTISVIIPVYNTELYLSRCLDSILNSDYDDLEIICVNDGSEDQSLKILKEYEKKDSRVRVIDIPNGGVSNARNIGLDMASGEFIAFVDSDDWVHRQYFSTLIDVQRRFDSDVTACNYLIAESDIEDTEYSVEEIPIKTFKKDTLQMRKIMMAYIWGKLYRKSLFADVRFDPSIAICEDLLFSVDLICHNEINQLVFADCSLYYYFNRESSASNSCEELDRACAGDAFTKRAKQSPSRELQEVYLDEAFRLLIKARYEMLKEPDGKQLSKINKMLNDWLLAEKGLKVLPFSKSKSYRIFAKYPMIYKCYRKIIRKIRH